MEQLTTCCTHEGRIQAPVILTNRIVTMILGIEHGHEHENGDAGSQGIARKGKSLRGLYKHMPCYWFPSPIIN
jgi:hypothetical protein